MSVNPEGAEREYLPSIAELLADTSRPTFSFEFFPPADAAAGDVLAQTILDLDATGPDWLSVTYGASGATRDRTIAATRFIKARTEAQTMGHLTCASQSTAVQASSMRSATGAPASTACGEMMAPPVAS